MKMVKRFCLISLLLVVILGVSITYASDAEIIGISNVTNGEVKAGTFEIDGVVLDNGQIKKVAVKVGLGPWETADGIEHWSYMVNTRHIVLGYENVVDPVSGESVATPQYGPYYGDLEIVVSALDVNDVTVAEKVIHITVIPEKPYSDICSGVYNEPINVVLKAVSEVSTYYTTDGTDPKISGTSYTGAIYVNRDTIIKAVAKSADGQYSEVSILDLKISNLNSPGFRIQYYEDPDFSRPLPDPPYLKAGTYYLKIVSDRRFSGGPFIDIDAPGSINDIYNASVVPVSDCVYQYTRVVTEDPAATGDIQEIIKIEGIDNQGNPVPDTLPVNMTSKAAYLDTLPPTAGSITLAGEMASTCDPTPELVINSSGAYLMRLALSESGLAGADWVKYADQYDELNISGGGNGDKTIWIEFKDQAGNIQTQHTSTSVIYDNAVLSFDIEYFTDSSLVHSSGSDPYLKAGTYYLKIIANQDLNYNPSLQIDSEGSNNDLVNGQTLRVNSRIFYAERTIVADDAAIGVTKEQIVIQGIVPSNVGSNAAYTDTQAPEIPVVNGPATTTDLKPVWFWNTVPDIVKYRYSFSEGTDWVETTTTTFTPDDNLAAGSTYTLYVQAGDKAGNWSNSGSFTTTIWEAETLTLGNWTPDSIAAGETKIYCFSTIPENTYAITWDSLYQGSRTYNAYILVSAYRRDLTTPYFEGFSSGYSYPRVFTAKDDIVYIKVTGYYADSSGSFALKAALNEPVMTVKQGTTDISNGSGNFDFGNIPLLTYNNGNTASFTVKNTGTCNLNLTGSPIVSIGGADASSFYVQSQPPAQIGINTSVNFTIKFYPSSPGTKRATVSISNDDLDSNPYTFTITGTGTVETLSLDTWTQGNITDSNDTKVYCFYATRGKSYAISWDDSYQGTGSYTGNITVDACHTDLDSSYIGDRNSGYLTPMIITAGENIVYLKVSVEDSASTGSFALKVSEIIPEPVITVKQGDTVIQSGTGIYDMGNVSVFDTQKVYFTIQNTGINNLTLSDSPVVEVAGIKGGIFGVSKQPSVNVIEPNQTTLFQVSFTATQIGTNSATIRIKNNDSDKNPYTFTITATGYAENLTFGTWTEGELSSYDDIKTYCFQSFPWNKYAISWDDSDNEYGNYTADIGVSAYWQNLSSVYFSNNDSGYNYPTIIKAMDGMVYLKVAVNNSNWGGTFAIKVTEIAPAINVKQGTTTISRGIGSYNFGNVAPGTNSGDVTFTIENIGGSQLYLTGSPIVSLSGTDAGFFSVTAQPATTSMTPDGNATFTVKFTPTEAGTKTATISIASNDPDKNPYTFTITGTGSTSENTSSLGTWIPGVISTAGEVKTYSFNTTPGTSYAIAWDDSYQGSGNYSCDVKVSAYQQNQTTAYFSNVDSGYTAPATITAQGNIVYVQVKGYSTSSTGSFALKVALSKPEMNVKQGTINILNGTGSFDFGNVSFGTSSSATFTVQNTGNRSLNLTGTPKVQISGTDASVFSVYTQPASPVALNGSTTFTVKFSPISIGTKTATVSIASDDTEKNPYTFTVTGTGANIAAETLALNTWTQGNITAPGNIKVYCFSATPGKSYTISWDDSYQGSSSYSCDVKVSAYQLNFLTAYFGSTDSGYTTPKTIKAQETMVYVKVEGYSSSSTGSYALKVTEVN